MIKSIDEINDLIARGRPQDLYLPSAPRKPVMILPEAYLPQPRFDVNAGGASALGFVVPDFQADRCLKAIHRRFFPLPAASAPTPSPIGDLP